ncbi:hypothetical protein B0J15DRAFT_411154 [Fusarium solani]|uniref:Uncharacterized protein n=1 Tax=Fusarium solani TaxID=169388 RepID=A0A9P9G0E6_FUSSL|nr:uncharacterized protein B0J15DRAFT_411154 [Fusarium solani]KAH7228635.1 hypothetical protein B0J15DRAFT_411154 [Fusarium solani]
MSDRPNRLTPEDIARMRQSAAADPAYRPRSRPQSAAAGSQHQGSRESHTQPLPPGRPSSEPPDHHQRPSNGPFKPPLEPIADDSPKIPRPPPGGFRQPPQGPSAKPPEHGDPPRHTTGGGTPKYRQNEQAHPRPPHQDSEDQRRQSHSRTSGGAFHRDVHRDPTPDNNQHKKPSPPRFETSSGYTNQPDPRARDEHQHTKHGHGHDPHQCRDHQEPPPRSHPGSHSKQAHQPPPDKQPPPPYSEDSTSEGYFKPHNTRPQTEDGHRFQPPPFSSPNTMFGMGALLPPDSLKWILWIIISVGTFILICFFAIKWSIIDIKDGLVSLVPTLIYGTFGAVKDLLYATGDIFSDTVSGTYGGVKTFLYEVGEVTSGMLGGVSSVTHDVLGAAAGFASSAWVVASAAFASQQQRPRGPAVINVAPLNPLIDMWAPGIQVAQSMAKQLGSFLKVTERNTVKDQKIKQVRQRNEEYTKELASTLADNYLWVDFLVKDIENHPLSVSCWPTPSNQSYSWFGGFKVSQCRRRLIDQLKSLSKALQDAHNSRFKLLSNVRHLLETDLDMIRTAACGQRNQYRSAYSRHLKDMKPGASDRKEVGSFLGKLAQLFGVGDSTCRMVEADYSNTETKVILMEDEVSLLRSSLTWLGGLIKQWETKEDDAASQKAADAVEKAVLDRVKEWLKMTEEYRQEM